MNAKTLFDYIAYFRGLWEQNLLAQSEEFKFCTCSGIETLQGPLQQFRTASAFFCVDDTNDGATFRGRNGGWFNKRTITVFLMHRYSIKDMASYESALGKCRMLFQQLLTRMLIDEDALSNDMVYLRTESVLSRELGQYFLNGCTGLYFMIEVAEPIDLTFDAKEWQN
ncbi:MAG: hypothetical protein J6X70_00850 [Muribaculaceae bacterium]|nr:hypothetical protein [Muribaculaceae bacterium]